MLTRAARRKSRTPLPRDAFTAKKEKLQLYQAIKTLDLEKIEYLVYWGASVIEPDKHSGEGLLHLLLEAIQKQIMKKWQPLYSRIFPKKYLQLFDVLLAEGARIDVKNRLGQTPLYKAVDYEFEEIVEYLVMNGAKVNDCAYDGKSVLSRAVKRRNLRLVRCLLKNGVDLEDKTALVAAFEYGGIEMVKLLLAEGVRIEAKDLDEYLHISIVDLNFDTVNYLLVVLGADINYQGRSDVALNYVYEKWRSCKMGFSDQVLQALLSHIALLESQGLHVREENFRLIEQSQHMRQFYQNCRDAIKHLRERKICEGFSTTIYDVLTMRSNALVNCLRNNGMVLGLQAVAPASMFKPYADKLQVIITNGLKLMAKMQKFEEILQAIFSSVLPGVVIRKISQLYSDADFRDLIKTQT